MKVVNYLLLVGIILFTTSCGFMFPEELTFDEDRVPGKYEGTITCSYEPCEVSGPSSFTITEGESYFTLQFEDSVSAHIQSLEFTIELDEERFGEAATVSGFIKLREGQDWKLTPYDQHYFYYWTYFDTQEEGERFEMRIYQPDTSESPQDIDYLDLKGHKGVQ